MKELIEPYYNPDYSLDRISELERLACKRGSNSHAFTEMIDWKSTRLNSSH